MATRGLGRDFRWLWGAYAVSAFGTRLAFDAFPMIAVLVLHAGPAEVAALAAVGPAVGALAAVPLGPWVEFRPKRPVMIAADLVRCAVLLSVPVAYVLGVLGLGQLLLVTVVVAAADITFTAAGGAFLKSLLPREHLLAANARFESTTWMATILGPPLGGFAIGVFGPVVTVATDAVSYLLSAVGLGAIGGRAADRGQAGERTGGERAAERAESGRPARPVGAERPGERPAGHSGTEPTAARAKTEQATEPTGTEPTTARAKTEPAAEPTGTERPGKRTDGERPARRTGAEPAAPRAEAGQGAKPVGGERPARRAPGGKRLSAGDVLEGWRYLLTQPVLRPLFLNSVLVNGLIMAVAPPLAVLMLGPLGFSPWQYGLAFAVPCVGGLVGSWLARRLADRYGRRRVLLAAGTLRVCWPLGLAFVGPGVAGLVMVMVVEFALITCIGVFNPLMATTRLELAPPDRVTRIMAAWSVTGKATIAAMTAAWGLLAGLTGPRTAIALAGALLLATPLLLLAVRRVPAALSGDVPVPHE